MSPTLSNSGGYASETIPDPSMVHFIGFQNAHLLTC